MKTDRGEEELRHNEWTVDVINGWILIAVDVYVKIKLSTQVY